MQYNERMRARLMAAEETVMHVLKDQERKGNVGRVSFLQVTQAPLRRVKCSFSLALMRCCQEKPARIQGLMEAAWQYEALASCRQQLPALPAVHGLLRETT